MSEDIASPETLGLDVEALNNLRSRIQHAVDKGPLPSVQLALARNSRLAHFETFTPGEASAAGSKSAPDNSNRYHVYSCTKPIVASAIWKLMGDGQINIELPVAYYLPQFTGGGKEAVTVEQVLCHTSGFPNASLDAPDWWTSEGRLARMSRWELEWEPGSQVVYHPLSGFWVLAELISAVSGQDFRDYIREEIFLPLGLGKLRLGVPPEEGDDIAHLAQVGEPPGDEEITAVFKDSVTWPDTQDDSLLIFNDPKVRALGIPGGGAVGTAADMALFYQALINNEKHLWNQAVLDDAVGTVRVDFPDPITRAPANRGLGVVIAGDDRYLPFRGMGSKVSPRAFGHQGAGGQVTWGDPVTGLSFCLLTNGLDANPLRSAHLCASASNHAGACVAFMPEEA
jgi:CubicO group peptidase (beta-lactamase class C family)